MTPASRTHFVVVLFVTLWIGEIAAAQDAGGSKLRKRPFAERVNTAIDRGVVWLKSSQFKDGSWGPCVATGTYQFGGNDRRRAHKTGPTAFSLFTLAVCGTPKTDRLAKKGIAWLAEAGKDTQKLTSYESSAIVLMLCAFNDPARVVPHTKNPHTRPRESRFTKREWRLLLDHVGHVFGCGRPNGGFGYWATGAPYADVSATQFAALALRSASRAGCPVRPGIWLRTARYLHGLQGPKGGFPYHKGEPLTAGMTAAALSSLILCREQLESAGVERPKWLTESTTRAHARLGSVFDVNKETNHYHYCYLYAVERVGMLSGRKVLGEKDWYVRGAEWLLARQEDDGKWVDSTCMAPKDVLGTCFALLFLKKATIPAVTRSED